MTEDKIIIEEVKTGEVPKWMVTFSDLATLLLTFFVLLLSMSSMDNKKGKNACSFLFFAVSLENKDLTKYIKDEILNFNFCYIDIM